MTVGEAHAYVVRQLAYLGLRLDPARMHLQTQQPVVIPDQGEPEPDAAIVQQPITATAKPRAEDVSCVLEVAGTSLERDRTTKLRHHAAGGIPQHVVLDLAERTAEEHLDPDPATGTYGCSTGAGSSFQASAPPRSALTFVYPFSSYSSARPAEVASCGQAQKKTISRSRGTSRAWSSASVMASSSPKLRHFSSSS